MSDVDVIATPESDAKALSDRELLEAIYVQNRRILDIAAQFGAMMEQVTPMLNDLASNPMFKMLLG